MPRQNRGKNINLYLMDGDAAGRIKCTLANWTGIAYKIPRTDIDRSRDRKELRQSGVYFLFGTSDDTGQPMVYVGQAGTRKNGEGLLSRIAEHRKRDSEEYWTEAVALTTANNTFGQTEISYLEHRFCNLAREAERYLVKNAVEPRPGNITEEKESELEEFIENARLVVGTLGYRVFEPLTDSPGQEEPAAPEKPELFLERTVQNGAWTVAARGRQTEEGFVVLAGSRICPEEGPGLYNIIRERRRSAPLDPDTYILQEDMLFKSPGGAAQFVTGAVVNGMTVWKTKDGRSLRSLENRTP